MAEVLSGALHTTVRVSEVIYIHICVGNILRLDQALRSVLVLFYFQLVKHEREAGEMLVKDADFTSISHSLNVK